MIHLKEIMYDVKPERVVMNKTSVDVIVNCESIEVNDEMSNTKSTKYKCDIERYEVVEYINKLRIEKNNLDSQVTDLQLALANIYEKTVS